MNFAINVRNIVKNIPKGNTLSYSDVARLAKNPNAARAVANIMVKNFDKDIPCHRVIKSDGTLGGYNRGGETAKKSLLASEGVVL
jgi:O-6-methylguanine DNA methyltransferase